MGLLDKFKRYEQSEQEERKGRRRRRRDSTAESEEVEGFVTDSSTDSQVVNGGGTNVSEPLPRQHASHLTHIVRSCSANCIFRQSARVRLDQPRPDQIWASKRYTANGPSIFTDLKPWQTRLIRLHPEPSGQARLEHSPLSCDLLTVDLVDAPGCAITNTSNIVQYEALSYSWGSSRPRRQISVNALDWAVSEELAEALMYLRREFVKGEDRSRYLWCDALCINQADPNEKGAQIRNMLRVFEKAENVIAWLGASRSSSGRLVRAFELAPSGNIFAEQDLLGESEECLETQEGLREALSFHTQSQWFLRTWVRQEVFAAKRLTLCLGGHNMSFELFVKNFDTLEWLCTTSPKFVNQRIEKPSTLSVLQQEFQHFGTDRFDFVQPKYRKEFSEHWLNVLSSGPLFGVSEERDRVYGALGILTSSVAKSFSRLPGNIDGLNARFPVSYDKEKPLGEVFGDVTKFLVNITGTANVLDLWRTPVVKYNPCSGLASWATDWRSFNAVVLPSRLSCGLPYDRSGFVNQLQQNYDRNGLLRLQGVRLPTLFTKIRALNDDSRRIPPIHDNLTHIVSENFNNHNTATIWIEEEEEEEEEGEEEENGQFNVHSMMLDLATKPDIIHSVQKGHYCLIDGIYNRQPWMSIGVFLAPRNAQLDDVVVSFYGSQYLHLVRPHGERESRYLYLGPVLPMVSIPVDTPMPNNEVHSVSCFSLSRLLSIIMTEGRMNGLKRETFDLV